MLRRGLLVSSPSAAAPSKPPKERSPKTEANAIAPIAVPEAGTNGFKLNDCPSGAVPPITFQKMTATTITISATEIPSKERRARVATLTSPYARNQTSAAAISETRIQDGLSQMPAPLRNEVPKRPISAMFAAMKHEYVASRAQPPKKPARGPSVAPASAYAEPAWLKKRVSRTNAYEMRAIATAANRNASGTARPTSPAGATPFSAIAAVGAIIPIEIAIASQKRSSRLRCPCDALSSADAAVAISASLVEDRFGHGTSHHPVARVNHLVRRG